MVCTSKSVNVVNINFVSGVKTEAMFYRSRTCKLSKVKAITKNLKIRNMQRPHNSMIAVFARSLAVTPADTTNLFFLIGAVCLLKIVHFLDPSSAQNLMICNAIHSTEFLYMGYKFRGKAFSTQLKHKTTTSHCQSLDL